MRKMAFRYDVGKMAEHATTGMILEERSLGTKTGKILERRLCTRTGKLFGKLAGNGIRKMYFIGKMNGEYRRGEATEPRKKGPGTHLEEID